LTELLDQLERGEISTEEANRRWLQQRARYEASRPSRKKSRPSQGLGDTVEKLIDIIFFGKVKTCGKCRKRRDRLNRRFPYGKRSD
jgi:hypothetical protein